MPGWHLSEQGIDEARQVGLNLADVSLDAIYSSPLERAVATAEAISHATGAPVSLDHRLIEWRLCEYWGGSTWESVRTERGHEFETYMRSPDQIDFIDENLGALADRMTEAVGELAASHPGGVIAVVSHSDPIKAAVLRMTGRDLSELHQLIVPTGGVLSLDFGPDGATLIET